MCVKGSYTVNSITAGAYFKVILSSPESTAITFLFPRRFKYSFTGKLSFESFSDFLINQVDFNNHVATKGTAITIPVLGFKSAGELMRALFAYNRVARYIAERTERQHLYNDMLFTNLIIASYFGMNYKSSYRAFRAFFHQAINGTNYGTDKMVTNVREFYANVTKGTTRVPQLQEALAKCYKKLGLNTDINNDFLKFAGYTEYKDVVKKVYDITVTPKELLNRGYEFKCNPSLTSLPRSLYEFYSYDTIKDIPILLLEGLNRINVKWQIYTSPKNVDANFRALINTLSPTDKKVLYAIATGANYLQYAGKTKVLNLNTDRVRLNYSTFLTNGMHKQEGYR